MHLEGSHKLNASPETVWKMMLDPDILTKVIPGLDTLEAQGDDKYKANSQIKMGPVNGAFKGTMEVVDKIPPQSFILKMKQSSRMGNVNAQGSIKLQAAGNNQTEILFAGDAKLSGTLSRTGQRVLSGVANTLTNQFFESLENEILLSQGQEVKKLPWWKKLIRMIQWFFGKKKTSQAEAQKAVS